MKRINSPLIIIGKIALYIICALFVVICLFPVIALIITMTRPTSEIMTGFSFKFGNSFLSNYEAFKEFAGDYGLSIGRSFLNSCLISFASTGLCIYFSALTSYACHVYDFKFKKFFEKLILFLIIIPGQLGAVGFFRIIMKLRLTDTYIPFIIPAIASASTVYFLRQYMKTNFSKEYVDAARMDGASEFKIFNMICLPYIKSALATMALFGIISSWNNFMGPATFLTDPKLFTLPQVVYWLSNSTFTDKGAIYVATFLTALPMLVVYIFMSKVILKGTSNGGIK